MLPEQLLNSLRVPVIGAPMFLVAFPPLVTAQCKAGIAGAFPHLNARSTEELDQWLTQIYADLEAHKQANPDAVIGPVGVNMVLHDSNPRWKDDLDIVIKHQVPLIFTSLGNPAKIVDKIHAYGGLVFSDVINIKHARKAASSGVDGIVCIGSGAGGHSPTQSAFSLVRSIREFWDGCLVLGGAIGDGYQVRAAETLGADMAFIGTRFIATQESNAQDEYKQMLVDASVEDLIYTDRLSGMGCNFLRPTLDQFGIVPEDLPPRQTDLSTMGDTNAKLWRDIWTSGHGLANIHDVPSVGALVARMEREYLDACNIPVSPLLKQK